MLRALIVAGCISIVLACCPASAAAAAATTGHLPDTVPAAPVGDWPVLGEGEMSPAVRVWATAYRNWCAANGGEVWAAVVVHRGRLIFEGHGPRTHVRQRHDCGSIKKSLQATVLGAALQQGRLSSLDEDALPYWKDAWQTPFENDRVITFRQFASYRDRWNDPAPPGVFRYNNASATAAGACIAGLFVDVRGARPRGIAEVARREVMEPIGADWELWHWGNDFVAGNPGTPGPRLVLEASVVELAKLGYLWLRRGDWNGRRIFSEAFYREAVTDWSPDTGSTRSGFIGHYGYWWFVNRGKALLPDAPEDAFYHIGNGYPKRATGLLIVPSMDVVAVLGMERLSDDQRWDVIKDSRGPGNDGMRRWSAEIVKLPGSVAPPAVRSADAIDVRLNLPYAGNTNPRQALDLFLPQGRGTVKLPVIVYIHGGGWYRGSKDAGEAMLRPFVETGAYAGVSIGYRLSGEASWPAQIHDAKAAIRWVRAHAAQYGLDAERIGVMGSSAGGTLAALLGTSGGERDLEGTVGPHGTESSRVTCVVNRFGRMNFLAAPSARSAPAQAAGLDVRMRALFGGTPESKAELARRASPVTHLSAGDPPILTTHGTRDATVSFAQAEEMDAAARAAGAPHLLLRLEGAGHGFVNAEERRRVAQFFDRHLRGITSAISTEPIVVPRK